MALETLAPDALLELTGLSGVLSSVTDDPDAPDGNWITATGNNTPGALRVGFATPSNPLTSGAGLQEFKIWVRQFDTGQTGDPTVRIELWEAGSLITIGPEVSVTGSGQLISFLWDGSLITNGADVEVKIVTTGSGGSPGKRNTVDIGAIELNADTSSLASVTQTLDLRFDLVTPLIQTVALRADILEEVTSALLLRSALDIEVSSDLALRFNVGTMTTPVTQTVALRQDLLEEVSSDLALRADITGSVTVTLALRADILASVTRSVALRFASNEEVFATLGLRHRLQSLLPAVGPRRRLAAPAARLGTQNNRLD